MNTKEVDDQMSSDQRQDDQVVMIESSDNHTNSLLAPIETPISLVSDVHQVPNPLVKASDLLPRKLLILDVEGLLVYVEGFMEKAPKLLQGMLLGRRRSSEGMVYRNLSRDVLSCSTLYFGRVATATYCMITYTICFPENSTASFYQVRSGQGFGYIGEVDAQQSRDQVGLEASEDCMGDISRFQC
ncbi:hypothetical protein R1sor_010163 [Riccia sorocarpa]|uniref:Uncharacterized protein n=1 Tax=Riccia sorocarpa TaxID=122646 RepID=A0ABD3I0V2_9MARC